jgi:cytochrome c-type biogenesis protein CcmH/NrfF
VLVPVAHAGHWLPYVIPAVVVLIAVVVTSVRERRRQEAAEGEQDADSQPSD